MARSSCAESKRRGARRLTFELGAAALLAAGCVDTAKPGGGPIEQSPGGGSSIDPGAGGGPDGVTDPLLPDTPARPPVACSGYPALGQPLVVEQSPSEDPAAAAPSADEALGPYEFRNVTILGGGFVSGIVFSTAAPNLIYARTDVGGAYRFDLTTARWAPLTDWVAANESNLMGIESIAADPSDPAKVYLAAGTYLTAGDGLILSSSDYGRTFARHFIGVPMGGNVDGRSMGERLAVDPNLPSTLYFGSRNDGLLVSRDSGVTWGLVTSFALTGARDLGVSFVLFDPRGAEPGQATPTLYAGVARLAADDAQAIQDGGADPRNPPDALYRSRDAGQSWEPVPGQPRELMPHHAALDGEGRLYLAYSDRPGPNDIRRGAVLRLDTLTDTWTNITPSRPQDQRGGFAGISADAQRPGVVMVSTMDVWAPDEIYRSVDAGECWTRIGPSAQYDARGAEWLKFGGASPSATGWMGDIEIDPFNGSRALYITGQGIWWSDDVNAADVGEPSHWSFHDEGLEETVALGLASPPSGARLLSALGDIAGFRHDDFEISPPNGMYDNPRFGNTTSLDFAEQDPAFVVRSGTNQGRRGAFSTDGGSTWTAFASEPPGGNGEGPIAVSADAGVIVWDPRAAGPHYSSDRGQSWQPCAGVSPPDGNTGALVSDRVNPAVFYARAGGNVFVSTDGGRSFTQAGSFGGGMGGGGGSARLRTAFGQEGHLWVSSNGGLWHSADFGASFTRLSSVNSAPALGFGQSATEGGYPALYLAGSAAGSTGLFRSDDTGASWIAIDDVRNKFGYINHVSGDPRQYGRVYLGTGGRGILFGDPRP